MTSTLHELLGFLFSLRPSITALCAHAGVSEAGVGRRGPVRVKAKKGVNLLETKSRNAQWQVGWEMQSGAKHSITTIDVSKNKAAKQGFTQDCNGLCLDRSYFALCTWWQFIERSYMYSLQRAILMTALVCHRQTGVFVFGQTRSASLCKGDIWGGMLLRVCQSKVEIKAKVFGMNREKLNYFTCMSIRAIREVLGNVEVMQLDFEMENFTSLSVTRRINWNIDYKGQSPPPESEKVVTELTVVQRDIQAIIPLAMILKICQATLVVFLVEKFEGLATFVFEIAMKKKEKINLELVHNLESYSS
ncbi:hypothetical protein KUCAC02_026817 [Chaenocephalus aceratus]|nr:hypothetical protein KUCAC02_026817 [Chaenocephalus aceratus]